MQVRGDRDGRRAGRNRRASHLRHLEPQAADQGKRILVASRATAAIAGLRCRLFLPGPGVDPHLMLPVVSLNDPTDVSRVQHAGDTVSGVLTLLECANDEDLHWATSRHLPAGPRPHFRRAVADRGSARRVGGGRSLVVHIGASEPLVVPGHATSLPRRRHGEDSEDNQQCQEEQEGQPVGHGTSSGRRSVGPNGRTRPATWSHHPVYVRVFGRDGRLVVLCQVCVAWVVCG